MYFYLYILAIDIVILTIIYNKFNAIAKFFSVYDFPSNRKIHKKKTPLLGGLLIIFFFFLNLIILEINSDKTFFNYLNIESYKFYIFLFVILLFKFLLGLYDDKYILKNFVKLIWVIFFSYLLVQNHQNINIAVLNFSFYEKFSIARYSLVFTLICIVSLTIFMNLYDGMNLQSCLFYSINFLLLFLYTKNIFFIYLFLLPLVYFLIFNFSGKCFLGDSGSNFLSTIFGIILIRFYLNYDEIYVDHILLIVLIPFIDSVRIFINRILKKRSPLVADKNHIHHKILSRFSYSNTILILSIFPLINLFTILFKLNIYLGFLLNIFLYIYLMLGKKKIFKKKM